ncbi:MAG: DNA polymerase III subunit beta [Armatimonadota bacterium]|nr:DNA polymerase III subunit beta [Armatimonadota bacterium]
MLFTCEHKHLSRAVALVGRAVSVRTAMPILANILLETQKGAVKLIATDLDHGIQTTIPATVTHGGAVTLPARLLSEIVTNLPDAPVQIRASDSSREVEIQCERVTYALVGMPASDFPIVPEPTVATTVSVDAGTLRSMMRQTAFAVSTDETRVFLTGLYLVLEAAEMRLVATDGGRLALRTTRLATPVVQNVGIIVPARTMNELNRALAGFEGLVEIAVAENQVAFAFADTRVVSRLIPGPFPNYQQVIPQGHKQRIVVATDALLGAVRRVAVTARDSANVVRVVAQGDRLTLSSHTPEYGRAEEILEVRTEGETVPTAFNARYLMECLAVVEAAEVALELTGSLSPGAVRPVGQPEYVYVLAPVRVAS